MRGDGSETILFPFELVTIDNDLWLIPIRFCTVQLYYISIIAVLRAVIELLGEEEEFTALGFFTVNKGLIIGTQRIFISRE